ncbi:MAG: glycosyltransferase family 4 protein [Coleofasciculus sp. G3-WIS-01]|uniref:glycosyltransferase family 4 protein n=1 Tax=Coleofasciculus sp. G3-WIS-01 TaxID=3069528 RepID=UPI0032F1A60D
MKYNIKVLLIIEQCNPRWQSVPLEGYKYFQAISQIVETTLVTHDRNEKDIKEISEPNNRIVYIQEMDVLKRYYSLVENLTYKNKTKWQLYNSLMYPIYADFNHKVYRQFKEKILNGDYDIVHAITPMIPRYPYKINKVCQQTPFLLGPVNGGIPFPPGFRTKAREEFAYLNFLRAIGRFLIPGYRETYKKADRILAGSTYTLNLLKRLFKISDSRISLFFENGIDSRFVLTQKQPKQDAKIHLLFVGRLVPYKCADIVIKSIGQLNPTILNKIELTIVGDGSEKIKLENLVQKLGLNDIVQFIGWVPQSQTLDYYRQADIFCFPSIREFGGAVVLEAMANGLPCIVVNYGGIGEYVTEETGFKIEPISPEHLTQELTQKIKILVEDDQLRESMSVKSIERARQFTWERKAIEIVEIYEQMISEKRSLDK